MHSKPTVRAGAVTASMDELMPVMLEALAAGQEIRLYPRGRSMRPLLREGRDSVTLSRPTGALSLYDMALFCCEGRYVLHRVIGKRADGYVFCGDGRVRCEVGITDEQIVAVVTALARGGRKMPMDSRRYRAYIRRIVWRQRLGRFCLRLWHRLRRG